MQNTIRLRWALSLDVFCLALGIVKSAEEPELARQLRFSLTKWESEKDSSLRKASVPRVKAGRRARPSGRQPKESSNEAEAKSEGNRAVTRSEKKRMEDRRRKQAVGGGEGGHRVQRGTR